jgi:hypothetical protein
VSISVGGEVNIRCIMSEYLRPHRLIL